MSQREFILCFIFRVQAEKKNAREMLKWITGISVKNKSNRDYKNKRIRKKEKQKKNEESKFAQRWQSI